MTTDELIRLIARAEDNFVERKPESVKAAELRRTMCAFANSVPYGREAVLFIGIGDRGGLVLGVRDSDKLQKRIREACHSDC